METRIFIKASDKKIHEAFDAIEKKRLSAKYTQDNKHRE